MPQSTLHLLPKLRHLAKLPAYLFSQRFLHLQPLLTWLMIGCFISSCWGMSAEAKAADSQTAVPNILLIIADDWSWSHAGVYGDKVVKTPAIDRIAAEGVRFNHAYCASPSCTPSRAGLLTGQAIHRLQEGGNLWSFLPSQHKTYPELLASAGYDTGFCLKGWAPGTLDHTERTMNPAGERYPNFVNFIKQRPNQKQPFVFWHGSHDAHRPFEPGSGRRLGIDPAQVEVPPYLPDTPEVRNDIADYYGEVQSFDAQVAQYLHELEKRGQLDNTLIVVTADNGWAFPRSKANLYDSGTRMPLLIRWPKQIPAGTVIDDFVSLTDLAPTFLEAAGLPIPPEMTGRSLLKLASGEPETGRDHIFLERERHANVRQGNASYPIRSVRNHHWSYIRNYEPNRWPAGDPELWHSVGPYGDVDGSPSKLAILQLDQETRSTELYRLAFAKRPAEELYDLRTDPHQLNNLAAEPEQAEVIAQLRARLDQWMQETADPRATDPQSALWDNYLYVGPGKKKK